jgi:hypothetical protein
VRREVVRIKAWSPTLGCHKIADAFNRRFAGSKRMTVSNRQMMVSAKSADENSLNACLAKRKRAKKSVQTSAHAGVDSADGTLVQETFKTAAGAAKIVGRPEWTRTEESSKIPGWFNLYSASLCTLAGLHMSFPAPNRVFLLSFPRSGNTWVRYGVEFLSGRPTRWKKGAAGAHTQPLNEPLGNIFPCIRNDTRKGCVWKIHSAGELERSHGPILATDSLILLLRNYKENWNRQDACQATTVRNPRRGRGGWSRLFISYFTSLRLYHDWNPQRRMLVYYEDLIREARSQFHRILDFLDEPLDRMEEFMSELPNHQNNALLEYSRQYRPSITRGRHAVFHSRQIRSEDRLGLDRTIAATFPDLWEIYLKDQYSEAALARNRVYEN